MFNDHNGPTSPCSIRRSIRTLTVRRRFIALLPVYSRTDSGQVIVHGCTFVSRLKHRLSLLLWRPPLHRHCGRQDCVPCASSKGQDALKKKKKRLTRGLKLVARHCCDNRLPAHRHYTEGVLVSAVLPWYQCFQGHATANMGKCHLASVISVRQQKYLLIR